MSSPIWEWASQDREQGGGAAPTLSAIRSILDARRSMGGEARTPSADYPDGLHSERLPPEAKTNCAEEGQDPP